MTREARKVTLWTSDYSDRSGLEKVALDVQISDEVKGRISAAFSQESTDNRIKMYTPTTDSTTLARAFG